ncbi:glycosyltransferase [Candidatus Chlorohelix sp.]|uniref:glycosyltransferase n=1 Tax=Candidatus Chlorohelix sp. TaxID=3139201 RepID=UPI003062ED1B
MIDASNPDFTNTPVSTKRAKLSYSPTDKTQVPAVTIVTPFYNTSSVFQETAQSVMGQSFQQWEWLIVNDGSTNPESIAMLSDLAQADSRIRIINHQENKGLSAARNTGFKEATTPYVVLLDSDDLLEITAVEKWYWFLETHPEYSFVTGYNVAFEGQEYLWSSGYEDGSTFLEENSVDVTSMVRKAVHEAVGGFDEDIRGGLEDWDFWCKCGNYGFWGGTVPEYLDWYRRRIIHSDRWEKISDANRKAFQGNLKSKYPKLWVEGFPKIQPTQHDFYAPIPTAIPCKNLLHKTKPRLLMILSWLDMGGADKFSLDLLEQLTNKGWEVSIVTTLRAGTNPWLSQFSRFTSDIFILKNFLSTFDFPRYISYLISSRQYDTIFISNSELGYYLLPFLRASFPELPIIDYCHMEEEYWRNGGSAGWSVEAEDLLDLHVVSSEHLKRWMIKRGLSEERIRVCYTNIDIEKWKPLPEKKITVREQLKIDSEMPVLLYAGRITAQKQPKVFAKTMLQLAQGGLEFKALVAGDGPDLEWLRAFVDKHNLKEQVILLGAVSNERVKELLNAADIFFLPSAMEGISLAFFEAMATGVVPVGAAVGGQRELVTDECGFLIERGNETDEIEKYTGILSKLIKEPQLRRQMGNASRERVAAHFRLEEMGNRMEALIKEAKIVHRQYPLPPVEQMPGIKAATKGMTLILYEEHIEYLGKGIDSQKRTILEFEQKMYALWEEKKYEVWVREIEIEHLKASKLYRLEKTLKEDKNPIKKFAGIVYILGSLLTPRILRKRLEPLLKAKKV